MKHFIIRPELGEINEIFYLDKSEPKYQWIQRMIGGNFDCVDINDEGDTIYVNDEGLLKNSNYFFEVNSPLYEKPYPLAGTAIVSGTNMEGDDAKPKITHKELKEIIKFKGNHKIDNDALGFKIAAIH